MVRDSGMGLGYSGVGVSLLDPDSGVVVWNKLFRWDRVRAVITGRVGMFLIILLDNLLAGSMYGILLAPVGMIWCTFSGCVSHFVKRAWFASWVS